MTNKHGSTDGGQLSGTIDKISKSIPISDNYQMGSYQGYTGNLFRYCRI